MSITPLDEHALDFLDAEPRRVIKEALKAVVEHPNIYDNGFFLERDQRGGGFVFFLANGNRPGPFTNNQGIPVDVTNTLIHHGIAGPKVNPRWPQQFRSFTEAALEWQRTYGGITADEIRKGIGRILAQQVGTGKFYDFDPENAATIIGTTPEQIRKQVEILHGVGLVERLRAGDGGRLGFLELGKPNGLLWAERGYPPIQSLTSQTIKVRVDLHVEVRTIIEQAQATDLPQETKDRFELLLHRATECPRKRYGQVYARIGSRK